jgi:TP901 family phage tail tape measure protein
MFASPLNLGIAIVLKDGVSYRAGNVQRAFRSMEYAAYSAARGMNRAAVDVESSFNNITRSVFAAGAVLSSLAFPVKQAVEFGKALSEVETIADEFTSNMGRLSDSILKQITDFPGDLVTQSQAVYEAVSAGFLNTADASYIASEATKTAAVTFTDTKTVLDGLVGTMNAYRLSADKAAEVSDAFFQTVKFGKVRGSEVARFFPLVSSSGAALGIPYKELLGTYASMTLGGLPPEAAAQYLRQIVLGFNHPKKEARKVAASMGMDLSVGHLRDLEKQSPGYGMQRFLQEMYAKSMAKGGARSGSELFQTMLTGRQAFAGATTLTQNMGRWKFILDNMFSDERFDEYGRRYSNRLYALYIRSKQLDYQLSRLRGTFQVLGQSLGKPVINGLSGPIGALATGIGHLGQMLTKHQGIARGLTTWVQALGAALLTYGGVMMGRRAGAYARGFQPGTIDFVNHMTRPWLGVNMTMRNVIPRLTATFMLLGGALAVYRRMLERNTFHLAERTAKFNVVKDALMEALGNMTGAKGSISEDTFKALQRTPGGVAAFEKWFRILYRLGQFGKGFMSGFGDVFKGISDFVIDGLEKLAKVIGKIAPNWGRRLETFLQSLSAANPHRFLAWGVAVGKFVGVLTALIAIPRTLTGLRLIGGTLLWMARAPIVTPWNLLTGAFLRLANAARSVVASVRGLRFLMFGRSGGIMGPLTAAQAAHGAAGGLFGRGRRAYAAAGGISGMASDVWSVVANRAGGAFRAVRSAPGRLVGAVGRGFQNIGALALQGLLGAGSGIARGLSAIGSAARIAGGAVVSFGRMFLSTMVEMAVAMATNPVGLAIMAVVAVLAVLYFKWGAFRTFFLNSWTHIKGVFVSWWGWVSRIGNFITDKLGGAWTWVKDKAMTALNGIMSMFHKLWDNPFVIWLRQKFGDVARGLQNMGASAGVLDTLVDSHTRYGQETDKHYYQRISDDDLSTLEATLDRYQNKNDPIRKNGDYTRLLDAYIGHLANLRSAVMYENPLALTNGKLMLGALGSTDLNAMIRDRLQAAGLDKLIGVDAVTASGVGNPPPPSEDDIHDLGDNLGGKLDENKDAIYDVNKTLMKYSPFRVWEFPKTALKDPFEAEQAKFLDLLAKGQTAPQAKAAAHQQNLQESIDSMKGALEAVGSDMKAVAGRAMHVTMKLKDKVLGEAAVSAVQNQVRTDRERGKNLSGSSIIPIPAMP